MGRDEYLDSIGKKWHYRTEEENKAVFQHVKEFQEKEKQKAVEIEAVRPEMMPVNENEFVKVCSEHGRYHGEFSYVNSAKIGTIEESDMKCPCCGETCKIISLIEYEINEYRPMSREEWEEY